MRKIADFREHLVQRAVQRLRRGEVAAERLLDDDARVRRRSPTCARPCTTVANMLGGIAR